jgi:hypothetical protein
VWTDALLVATAVVCSALVSLACGIVFFSLAFWLGRVSDAGGAGVQPWIAPIRVRKPVRDVWMKSARVEGLRYSG